MTRRTQSRGPCAFCGTMFAKGGLTRHLAACPERQEAIRAADQRAGKTQQLAHLQVRDAWGGDYWLHLEMNGTATLDALDNYLRAIWLECCGHLSQFSVGGWRGDEIPMSTTIARVFAPGVELTHIYDFGTSSETLVKVVGTREGRPLTGHPITLMARNEAPEADCMECGERARWMCPECVNEFDQSGLLCERHAEDHPHDEDLLMAVVNSPRMGMCGYSGPAEPPY